MGIHVDMDIDSDIVSISYLEVRGTYNWLHICRNIPLIRPLVERSRL